MIDRREASAALADIEDIVQRVKRSQLYELASLAALWWGVLVFCANLVTWSLPRYAGIAWVMVDLLGVAGMIVFRVIRPRPDGDRLADLRLLAVFALFFGFGYLCTQVLAEFGPRQLGAFWPIYFMLFYALAGLWFGAAFIAIGLGISALTLVGFFWIGPAFPLWMAFVNGGGLVLGGLWMRRI